MRELYDEQAKQRQLATLKKGKRKPLETPVPEELPEREIRGETRDLVGQMVGVSGRTIDDATKVR